jgi:hypothetical protein
MLEIVSFSFRTLITHKKHIAYNASNSAGKTNNSVFWMLSSRQSTVQNLLVYKLLYNMSNKKVSH